MHSNQEKSRVRNFFTVIKIVTFFLCMAGFIANSYIIFIQFIGKNTITSQNYEHYDGLLLPSITLCSLSGFKEIIDDYEDLKLESYLNKTLDLEEILYGYYDYESRRVVDVEEMKSNTTLWEITTIYSKYKGRCHTLSYTNLVRMVKENYLCQLFKQISIK